MSVRKNAKKFVELTCNNCGQEFSKHKSEYLRKLKNGYKNFYCSPFCFHKGILDEFAPFRRMLYRAKQSAQYRKLAFNLTLPFLKTLWERQKGICPYSGLTMVLPDKPKDVLSSPYQASIDRIISNKGYTQDNVEFVLLFVNLGKNDFCKDDVYTLFQRIKSGL